MMLLAEGMEKTREVVNEEGKRVTQVVRKGMKRDAAEAEMDQLEAGRDVTMGKMLRWKLRYFTDGAVLGSRGFVDGIFEQCRDRFGPKRTSGARRMRGRAGGAAGFLWSARDLQRDIG